MTTEQWVARLNKLAREMDACAASLHPSAWHDALAPQREQYEKISKGASGITRTGTVAKKGCNLLGRFRT